MIDIGRVAAVRLVVFSSEQKNILENQIIFMFSKTVDKTAQESEKINTEKEKRRIARLKERRATLILGKN